MAWKEIRFGLNRCTSCAPKCVQESAVFDTIFVSLILHQGEIARILQFEWSRSHRVPSSQNSIMDAVIEITSFCAIWGPDLLYISFVNLLPVFLTSRSYVCSQRKNKNSVLFFFVSLSIRWSQTHAMHKIVVDTIFTYVRFLFLFFFACWYTIYPMTMYFKKCNGIREQLCLYKYISPSFLIHFKHFHCREHRSHLSMIH